MCLGVSWLQFLVVSFGMSSRSLNLIFGIGCAWLVEVEFSLSCRECVGGSRGVYLDRECFSQFSLVCYRIPEGVGVRWWRRWISPSCRGRGVEGRKVYLV